MLTKAEQLLSYVQVFKPLTRRITLHTTQAFQLPIPAQSFFQKLSCYDTATIVQSRITGLYLDDDDECASSPVINCTLLPCLCCASSPNYVSRSICLVGIWLQICVLKREYARQRRTQTCTAWGVNSRSVNDGGRAHE
jgi:hypothetical protein